MKKKCPVCNSSKITKAIVKGKLIFNCKKCGYINKLELKSRH